MSGSISLGKIFGIEIRLHVSWFLVAALVTATLALGFFPAKYAGWSTFAFWVVGRDSVLFFASVLLHELGHSLWRCTKRCRSRALRSLSLEVCRRSRPSRRRRDLNSGLPLRGPWSALRWRPFSRLWGPLFTALPTWQPVGIPRTINLLLVRST